MKIAKFRQSLFTGLLLFSAYAGMSQKPTEVNSPKNTKTTVMKTYLIEREVPGASKLTPEQLKSMSQTSCTVLKELGQSIQWVQSYVNGNKICCVYKAENEELIREHARKAGFPANSITEIAAIISPATAQ